MNVRFWPIVLKNSVFRVHQNSSAHRSTNAPEIRGGGYLECLISLHTVSGCLYLRDELNFRTE